MTMTTTTRHPRVPGVRVELDKVKAAKGQPKPWALWIEVKLPGILKPLREPKFYATEDEAEAKYAEAAEKVAALRQHAALQQKLKKSLVPALPKAPDGCELFETLALRWLAQTIKPPRKKASTYRGFQAILQNHLLPIMRTWPVTDEVMSTQRLVDVLGRQLYARKVSLKTRVKAKAVLSILFGWAITAQQVPAKLFSRNPVQNVGAGALRQDDEFEIELDTLPNPMTRQQLEEFLAWQKEHRDPTLYRLFLWLGKHGSRLNEALALQWDRLDLVKETGHIRETFSGSQRWMEVQAEKAATHKGREGLGLQPTKTRQSQQHINLDPQVCSELALQQKENLAAWMKRGAYGTRPTFVFLNATDSHPLHAGARIYDAFRDGCEALGLKGDTGEPFVVHDLRATFITLAIMDGHDINWVARMVGHKGTGTINKHYFRWIHQGAENPFRRGLR